MAKRTMIISCPNCATRYAVPDTAIGVEGRTVRCAKCKHSWFQEPPESLLVEAETETVDGSSQTAPTAPREAATEPASSEPPSVSAPSPPPPEGASAEPAPEEPVSGPATQRGPVIPKPVGATTPDTVGSPPRIPTPPAPANEPDGEVGEAVDGPSVSHWTTSDADMSSIAAQARSAGAESAQTRSEDAPDSEAGFGFERDPLASSFPDTLAEEDEPESEYSEGATPFDDDYESRYAEGEDEEDVSQFEYRAPFTARRNPLKMWTIAAVVFALMAGGTAIAVNYVGLPAGLPFNRPTFGIGKPDLVLNFPAAQQRKEILETGVEIFRVRGSITNAGTETETVPRLIVVFVDENDKEIFSKTVVPAKNELAPGESLNVTEGISDYPAEARRARLGWAPS